MYAVNAFDVGAIDYLTKPFDDERFAKALSRAKAALSVQRLRSHNSANDSGWAMREQKTGRDSLLVKENSRILLVPMRDIELVQVTSKYVKIVDQSHCYLTRKSLRSIESRLDSRCFVRVHRSTIINVEQIVELRSLLHGDCELVLRRRTRVAVSRRFRNRLTPFLMNCSGLSGVEKALSSKCERQRLTQDFL